MRSTLKRSARSKKMRKNRTKKQVGGSSVGPETFSTVKELIDFVKNAIHVILSNMEVKQIDTRKNKNGKNIQHNILSMVKQKLLMMIILNSLYLFLHQQKIKKYDKSTHNSSSSKCQPFSIPIWNLAGSIGS